MRLAAVFALFVAACSGSDKTSEPAGTTPSVPPPAPAPIAKDTGNGSGSSTPVADDPKPTPPTPTPAPPPPIAKLEGADFTEAGKVLATVGACNDGPVPAGYDEAMVTKHCKVIKSAQSDYA